MSFASFFRNLFNRRPAPQPTPTPVPVEPPVAVVQPTVPTTLPTQVAPVSVAPFGTDGYGNPFKSQAERDVYDAAVAQRLKNLNETYAADQAVGGKGAIPVSSLTPEDKAFLLYAAENYAIPQGVFFAVLSGTRPEIDAAISFADNHRGQYAVAGRRDVVAGAVDAFAHSVK